MARLASLTESPPYQRKGTDLSQGRCEGCGATGPARKIAAHTLSCSDFARVYQQARQSGLDLSPEASLARWAQEGKGQQREARIARSVQDVTDRRAADADRFAALPDILA